MKFTFSARVNVFCGTLALLMIYASYWQYTRYVAKVALIKELDSRLKLDPQELKKLMSDNANIAELYYRRVKVRGVWDYEHEVILRNRKVNESAGVFVITPLKVEGLDKQVLVSRGFIPLSSSSKEARQKYRNGTSEEFTALLKESMTTKLFSPQDPQSGRDKPWVDAWLRVETTAIEKQLPYSIQPFYLEIMPSESNGINSQNIIQDKSERDQMMFLPGAGSRLGNFNNEHKDENYPLPVFDSIVPAGRHFSYIFEWAIMALGVILTGIMLQFRQKAKSNFRANLDSSVKN